MVARDNVDVVVCVETTAIGGRNINSIKNDYLIPALEFFAGPISEVDFCRVDRSSTFTLIPFKNSHCLPEPTYRVYGPFTSTKKFLDAFDKLEFNGGGGESHSCGQEGLAASMKAFEKLSKLRDADFVCSKHILYLANTPMYDIPVMECSMFAGKTIDNLCSELKERKVSVSVFCPRKIPFLYKLYENCGGDQPKDKNFAKDNRHMILLKNMVLEERPVTPRPSQSTTPGKQGTQAGYPFNQQQQQQSNFIQNPVGNMGQTVGGQNKLGAALAGSNPATGSQPQDNTTLKNLLDRKPTPFQQQNWPYQQQVRGQMPGGQINTRMMQPNQVSMSSNMIQNQQQGMGVVMSNMSGMQTNMSNQQTQGGMVVGGGGQQQQHNNPSGGGMVVGGPSQGGGGMMGGQQQQQGAMMPGRVPVQQKEKQMIWSGELEWQKKVKDGANEQKLSHSVSCTVSSTMQENGQPEVRSDNWPNKLIMQLIPKSVIHTIGNQYFKDAKSVFFHPQESDSLEALTKEMSAGFAGCVHFQGNTCDIRVLILLYGSEKKSYLGFIPHDQASFVERIMTVIQQQKAGHMRQGQNMQQQQQMMQQQQQQQQQGGMMPMQNTIIQQQGIMNQGVMSNQQQQPIMSTAAAGGGMMTSVGNTSSMMTAGAGNTGGMMTTGGNAGGMMTTGGNTGGMMTTGGNSGGMMTTGGNAGGMMTTGGNAGGMMTSGGNSGGMMTTGGNSGGMMTSGGNTGGMMTTGGNSGSMMTTGGNSGGMMTTGGGQQQQVMSTQGGGQMMMMSGNNMVRMSGGTGAGAQQQFMRMQPGGAPQHQNRPMMHNPGLRQILQQTPGGGGGGGMQVMAGMQGMQGSTINMQGGPNIMMQNRMQARVQGPGGMMQQQRGPGQQQEGSLRDLLSNREV